MVSTLNTDFPSDNHGLSVSSPLHCPLAKPHLSVAPLSLFSSPHLSLGMLGPVLGN